MSNFFLVDTPIRTRPIPHWNAAATANDEVDERTICIGPSTGSIGTFDRKHTKPILTPSTLRDPQISGIRCAQNVDVSVATCSFPAIGGTAIFLRRRFSFFSETPRGDS